ncbi:MAG TPA: OsmC family protein [Syntrophales bacterium]|nr:OsmC family protein [Syntrophales bacterium]
MPGTENDLVGYKEKINPITKATLRWEKDLIFIGSTEPGYDIEFDANAQWGCKPTEALLLSLAGCMGIDIVMILQKMRVRLASFRMDLVGERNPTPPQYYRAIEMALYLGGKNLDPSKVERAISLSKATYCSVYNSLRSDVELKVRYLLEEKEPQAGGQH